MRAKLAEQLRAEGMNRSALHSLYARAEVLETRGDLVRRLVGEREDTDSIWVDAKVFDEESNALDEAKRFPCTGAGEDEDRPYGSLDRLALRGGRNARTSRRDRRTDGDDRVMLSDTRGTSGQGLVVL